MSSLSHQLGALKGLSANALKAERQLTQASATQLEAATQGETTFEHCDSSDPDLASNLKVSQLYPVISELPFTYALSVQPVGEFKLIVALYHPEKNT